MSNLQRRGCGFSASSATGLRRYGWWLRIAIGCTVILTAGVASSQAPPSTPQASPPSEAFTAYRVEIVDAENGWPVPLVELKTTSSVRFVSDNAGVIAVDDPSLLNQPVWFSVSSHGYEVPADGFGFRGVRLTPRAGESHTLEVQRTSIAKRVGRLTGSGLFAESQKLGEQTEWRDAPLVGCDSVQNAVFRNRLFWLWGDTTLARYPLGVFDMTAATTTLEPFATDEPPLRPRFDHFLDAAGRPRGVADMPGDGPTWLTGVVALSTRDGDEKLVACYRKIAGHLEVYEAGQCVWNESEQRFEHLQTLWRREDDEPLPAALREGHPVRWTDPEGQRWILVGNPLPHARVPDQFQAWKELDQWQALKPQASLPAAGEDRRIVPHSGSIAWNAYRKRWVTVFMEKFGSPSAFGTLWYAEADQPTGPWGPAVEILSHDNYTFYNPRIHSELARQDSPILLFEGTYTAEFTDHAIPTPRYNYNQILYRLDLDDPALAAAVDALESR
ncbi:hypothetical protein [Roseimaritima sediminicola]|uniref:hypothetical protein n=1 Tax=Roseimaritima sediminicola TaxID=2662066 RepID=UPI00192A47C1|nr:hypothetical protein [Roseimaritima sediminicola]